MTLILSGTDGLSDVDGSAATPAIRGTDANTGIFFPAADTIAFTEGGVEAMRIDSSGNVGIGTSSPDSILTFAGNITSKANDNYGIGTNGGNNHFNVFATGASGAVRFWTGGASATGAGGGGTERARIDSSGNLLVGTTSSDPTVVGARINTSATIPQISVAVTTTSNNYLLYNTTAAAYRFFVSSAGVINATTTAITAISSDARLKQDIVDYDKGLAEVLALRPRYFAYKNEPDRKLSGFISQEVQTVIPEAIQPTFEDPEMLTYSIDWYSLLVKAIQEQQAIITQLQADVAALKAPQETP